MFYYVYILQSLKNKSLYIGYTANLKQRLEEHNTGKNLATKSFRPYKLIFYEAFLDRKDAKNREIYLKSGWGLRSIKKLLENFLKRICGQRGKSVMIFLAG
jgi:putative endonuclease